MGMKTGRNLQAEALVEIMLKKGLIEAVVFPNLGLRYHITPKGKAYARHFAESTRAVSEWADAEMGIDQSYKD